MGLESVDSAIVHAAVLLLSTIAMITDVRRGIIPNWLTLSTIVFAPILHGVFGGFGALLSSVLGLLVCALVPLLINLRGGMHGGDVKAFAAIGAIGGMVLGIEIQFLSLIAASFYALGQLTWNGRLAGALYNSVLVGLHPLLPGRWRREIPKELMHRIRLGAAIMLGSVIAIAGHYKYLMV